MNLSLGITLIISLFIIINPAFATQKSLNQVETAASLYEADSLYQSDQSGGVEGISLSGEISSASSVSYPLSINPGEKYFASFWSENTYTVNFTGKFKIRVYVPDPVPVVPSGCQTNPDIFKHATIVHTMRCAGFYGWNALAQYDWNRNAYGRNEKWWFILINKAVTWERDIYGDYYPGNADFTWPCPAGQGDYYTNAALTRGLESPWFYNIESGQYIRIVPGERRNVWADNAGGMTFEIVRPKEEKDEGANKKDPNTDQGHDPVNIINGNMYSTVQDLFIPGKGIPIEFSRAYNSQSIFNGPLGYGWTHNYNVLLTENPDGSITERDEDGTLIDFVYDDTEAVYKAWGHSVIIKNPDGTYILTRKGGTKYNFNSSGRLITITDRNNNQISLTYTDGSLTAVTDASGRRVNLSYTGGRITQIRDPANRLITYSYDVNNNLIQIGDPSNNTTTYAYDANHNLVTITHANGSHIYFAYDGEDRCIETKRDGDNQKFTFSYDPANSATTMTDANGNQKVFIYNKEKGVVTSITDALGNITTSTWDEDINRTSITQP